MLRQSSLGSWMPPALPAFLQSPATHFFLSFSFVFPVLPTRCKKAAFPEQGDVTADAHAHGMGFTATATHSHRSTFSCLSQMAEAGTGLLNSLTQFTRLRFSALAKSRTRIRMIHKIGDKSSIAPKKIVSLTVPPGLGPLLLMPTSKIGDPCKILHRKPFVKACASGEKHLESKAFCQPSCLSRDTGLQTHGIMARIHTKQKITSLEAPFGLVGPHNKRSARRS